MASNFTSGMLYESAYNIAFNWKSHLPNSVFKYHELVWKETNAPIELHMGVVLPFVSACLGRMYKGSFLDLPFCSQLILDQCGGIRCWEKCYKTALHFGTVRLHNSQQ